jgi:pimeloyl-ACP methyl ester carboxylesterase
VIHIVRIWSGSAEHIPSATLCALDGVGHFPFVEASAQFTQLVAAFIHDYDHTAV